MQHLIDVEAADATVPADKIMILGWVRAEPGGAVAMNARISAEMRTAHELSLLGSVAAAAVATYLCGETHLLSQLTAEEAAEALRGAAAAGQAAAVDGLLQVGVRMDATDSDGKTGWWLAVQKGHAQVLTLFAKAGADINARTKAGYSALQYSLHSGHVEASHALQEAGAVEDDGTNTS